MRFTLTFMLLGAAVLHPLRAQQCLAAFLDRQMIVDAYTPGGVCRVSAAARGSLAVYTVDLSPEASIPLDKVRFQIAIRDHETNTLRMFSEKPCREVPVQEVLARCKPGDRIVLLLLEGGYSLPHHEILIY